MSMLVLMNCQASAEWCLIRRSMSSASRRRRHRSGRSAWAWAGLMPRVMPGIASGAIFAFIHSWDEAVLILFIASRALFTLPRRMWDGINENLDPVMAVAACVMILLSMLMLAGDLWLRRRRER